MKLIQVLGTGCPKCIMLAGKAEAAVRELGIDATVERVTDIETILDFDVLNPPALVIDGVLTLQGKVPSTGQLKKLLE